jgi:hypothetical protein
MRVLMGHMSRGVLKRYSHIGMVESVKKAAVAGHGVLGRSRMTLSGLQGSIQESKMSLGGSKTHP